MRFFLILDHNSKRSFPGSFVDEIILGGIEKFQHSTRDFQIFYFRDYSRKYHRYPPLDPFLETKDPGFVRIRTSSDRTEIFIKNDFKTKKLERSPGRLQILIRTCETSFFKNMDFFMQK